MTMKTIDDKLDALQQQLNGAAAFIALSTCFVAVKLLALLLRKNLRSAWGWDDAFILASLGAFVPMCVFAIGMLLGWNQRVVSLTLLLSERQGIHEFLYYPRRGSHIGPSHHYLQDSLRYKHPLHAGLYVPKALALRTIPPNIRC